MGISPRARLRGFLVEHVAGTSELELLTADHFATLRHRIDWSGSLEVVADRFLTVVLNSGRDAELWEALREERHLLADQIDELQRLHEDSRAAGADLESDFDEFVAGLGGGSPYRGLLPFREEDAGFFCGRDALVAVLREAVRTRPFVAVVGPSGSGKSSLVHAGLVPGVRVGALGPGWDIVSFEPRDRPFTSLAAVLGQLLFDDLGEIDRLREGRRLATYLAAGEVEIEDVVRDAHRGRPAASRLLLVVDQWEQLYTLAPAEESRAFVDCVVRSLTVEGLTVVMTMRGDFYGEALAHRSLADALQGAVVNVGAASRTEAEQAMVVPAARAGVSFEDGLVERILDDVGVEPGNLPLLEFVLAELWRRRTSATLGHVDYEAIGRAQGAVATRADQVMSELAADEPVLRSIFLRLVQPGLAMADSRRPARVRDLDENGRRLVRSLARERLLVVSADADGDPVYELAHESLMHAWQPLRVWIEEDRQFLLWRQHLRASIDTWRNAAEHPDALLRGVPLEGAEDWLAQRGEELTPEQRAYIRASRAHAEREQQEQETAVRAGVGIVLAVRFQVASALLALAAIVTIWYQLSLEGWGRARAGSDASAFRYLQTDSGMLLFLLGPVATIFLAAVALYTLSGWLGSTHTVVATLDRDPRPHSRAYVRTSTLPPVNVYRPYRVLADVTSVLARAGGDPQHRWTRLLQTWSVLWMGAVTLGTLEIVAFALVGVTLEPLEPGILIATCVLVVLALAMTAWVVHTVTRALRSPLHGTSADPAPLPAVPAPRS